MTPTTRGHFRILGSLLIEERREPGLLATFRTQLLAPRRAMVETMLQRGIERGEIRADIDPLIVTEMIAGSVMGHHVILGLGSSEDWIRGLVDHVWHAIAPDGTWSGSRDRGPRKVDSVSGPRGPARRHRRAT